MRVTTNTFPNTLIDQLQLLTTRQNKLQTQAATGQKVKYLEDDPGAVRRIKDMQDESRSISQYQKNISALKELATVSYDSIKALKKISDRANEIATAADSTKSKDELRAYAIEISQLIQQAVQIGNSKHNGNYIFSGTQSNTAPFVINGTDSNGLVTSITTQVSYNPPTSTIPEFDIADGFSITAHIIAVNQTGSGPQGLFTNAANGADFLNHLLDLQNHLWNGDTTAIANNDRQNLLKDEDNIIFHVSANGALQARLEAAYSSASAKISSLEKLISNEADADLAQTLVKLSETQTAYQAALQSGALILNTSLLDYIR